MNEWNQKFNAFLDSLKRLFEVLFACATLVLLVFSLGAKYMVLWYYYFIPALCLFIGFIRFEGKIFKPFFILACCFLFPDKAIGIVKVFTQNSEVLEVINFCFEFGILKLIIIPFTAYCFIYLVLRENLNV